MKLINPTRSPARVAIGGFLIAMRASQIQLPQRTRLRPPLSLLAWGACACGLTFYLSIPSAEIVSSVFAPLENLGQR